MIFLAINILFWSKEIWNIFFMWRKSPNILVLIFENFSIPSYRTFCHKEIKVVLNWPRPFSQIEWFFLNFFLNFFFLGPFVMNTEEELFQAMDDYKSCTNGFERGRSWQSSFIQSSSWFLTSPNITFWSF